MNEIQIHDDCWLFFSGYTEMSLWWYDGSWWWFRLETCDTINQANSMWSLDLLKSQKNSFWISFLNVQRIDIWTWVFLVVLLTIVNAIALMMICLSVFWRSNQSIYNTITISPFEEIHPSIHPHRSQQTQPHLLHINNNQQTTIPI